MPSQFWEALTLLLVAFVAVEAVVLIGVMRQLGGVIVQLRPARVGELPDAGPEVGSAVAVDGLQPDRPAVFLFVSPGCSICQPLLPAIPAFARANTELDVFAVVLGSDEPARLRYASEIGRHARLDLGYLEAEWRIPGTPFAVAITADHHVARNGVTNSLDQLDSLAFELVIGLAHEPDELENDPASVGELSDRAPQPA